MSHRAVLRRAAERDLSRRNPTAQPRKTGRSQSAAHVHMSKPFVGGKKKETCEYMQRACVRAPHWEAPEGCGREVAKAQRAPPHVHTSAAP